MKLQPVVMARDFGSAKSRLAAVLSPAERAELAASFLGHVLEVLSSCPSAQQPIVVTDDARVGELATAHGARFRVLPTGLFSSVRAALADLQGAPAMILMADLPLLAPSDIEHMAGALDHADVAIGPDHHDDGTSALAINLGVEIATQFGVPGSFALHQADARARGLRVEIVRRPGLAFDVDSQDDLASLARGRL